jgi:hypothetical protein
MKIENVPESLKEHLRFGRPTLGRIPFFYHNGEQWACYDGEYTGSVPDGNFFYVYIGYVIDSLNETLTVENIKNIALPNKTKENLI